jgi:hypothetical protein
MFQQNRAAILALTFAALAASTAQAKEKVKATCFYESGQSGGHALSDFAIWNMSAFTMPKGTIVTFTSTGAPGKTFTATAPSNIEPHDSFSSGGNIPVGSCQASWMK